MGNYTQADRPLRIDTPLGPDVLLLQNFAGEEGVSMPFRFDLDMLSENPGIDPDQILYKPVTVHIGLASGERVIHGRVSRFLQFGRAEGLTSYRAEMVPWLWFLSLSSDCRIFQNKSVPDIIEEVFRDLGYTDFQRKLYKTHPAREYCVQYRETHLNFVSRLMEEEGIFYYFEHSAQAHKLILADSPAAILDCPVQSRVRVHPESVPELGEDVITEVQLEHQACTGKITLNDYDFQKPSATLRATVEGKRKDQEVYDYPGNHLVLDEGTRLGSIRLEAEEARARLIRGRGHCRTLVSGYKFTLADHYREDANQSYLLLRVRHEMRTSSYRAGGEVRADYQNAFEALPHQVPYRPPRLARKPLIHGTQTAVVVGPAGEEIYVDKYGRVKVQFYWDRKGRKDENSSCWIRVSQSWAGKNWGHIQIPRIGQEVVVSFLEGDPDRPLITGRVYNDEQMPPYALPANKTQSGVKSRSSMGGGSADFNEFRFEDKKGSEEIYLHAQKDWNTVVENDKTEQVGRDETLTVKRNRTRTIEQGDENVTLKMGNQTILLKMGNQSTKMELGKSEHEAMQSIELKVGQSSVKLDQMGVTIKGMTIKIEGQITVDVQGLMTTVKGNGMLIEKGGIVMIN